MTIDKILTGRFTGPPVFLLVMLMIFHLTFNVAGKFLSDWLSTLIGSGISALNYILLNAQIHPLLHALIIDGACTGIGSVLSFVPTIAVLFFFLSILEESGYLPNIAAMMDKTMMKLGLSGKCIIPLIMGFGCSVPAVIAAGSMLSGKDRIKTICLIPFMSCSAKLPIYAMFVSIFFENHRALAMASIYFTGILLAILYALVVKSASSTSAKYSPAHVSYKLPNLRTVFGVVAENVISFIKKAFTVIFIASIIIWFLQSFDGSLSLVTDIDDSLLVSIGKYAAPLFAPLGFGDWRAAAAIICGLSAKEAIISTFAVMSKSAAGASLSEILSETFAPLSAFSFMIFCLLYVPCIATLTAVRNQTGSRRKSIKMALTQTAIAWIASFIVYHGGKLILTLAVS